MTDMTDMIEPKSRPGPQADDTNSAPAARKLSRIFHKVALGLGVLTVGLGAAFFAGGGLYLVAQAAGNHQFSSSALTFMTYALSGALITAPYAVAATLAGHMCDDFANHQEGVKNNQTPAPSP